MRYQPACVIERWRPEQIPTPTTKYWQEQNQPTGRHFIQCCHIDRLIPPPRPQIQSAAFQFNPFKWFHLPHSISRWNALGWVGMGIPLPAVGHFHPFPSISIHFHPFPSDFPLLRRWIWYLLSDRSWTALASGENWPIEFISTRFLSHEFQSQVIFSVLVLTWRHLKTSRNSNYSAEFTHQLNSKYTWRFLQQSSFFEISNFAVVDSLRMNESFDPARLSFAYEIWPIGWPQSSLLHNINGWLNELDWIMNYLQFFLEKARDEFEYQIDV